MNSDRGTYSSALGSIDELVQVEEHLTELRKSARSTLHEGDRSRELVGVRCAAQGQGEPASHLCGRIRPSVSHEAFGELVRLEQHERVVHQDQRLARND